MGNPHLPGEEPGGNGVRPSQGGENILTQSHNCCHFLTACRVPGGAQCLTVKILDPDLPGFKTRLCHSPAMGSGQGT